MLIHTSPSSSSLCIGIQTQSEQVPKLDKQARLKFRKKEKEDKVKKLSFSFRTVPRGIFSIISLFI